MTAARLTAAVLDARDPRRLAEFYAALLGWQLETVEPDWVTVRGPHGSGAGLSFQLEPLQTAPTWPARSGAPSQQMHLDVEVDDLQAAVARAVDLGAVVETHQPQDDVRVLRDPEGHLLCLWVDGSGTPPAQERAQERAQESQR